MTFVEKEDFAWLQTGEDCGEVTGVLNGWARGDAKRSFELGGDDRCERRLAQTGWARKQHVISTSTSQARGF
jgi:hypothetical protein